METSKNNPWYKRWTVWAGVFAVLFVMSLFVPDEAAKDAVEPEVAPTKVSVPKKTPEELAAITAEVEAKNKAEEEAWLKESAEKAEKDAKAKEVKDADKAYADETLADIYESIYADSEGVIVNIEPEDDYEIINVQLADDFAYIPVELKQAFVDEYGGKIEASTRAVMFDQRPSTDKLYVYFVNSKGEYLVDTKHFDYGWKAK